MELSFRLYVSLGFFFSSRRRHTRFKCDWSSDVCSSDLDHITDKKVDNLLSRLAHNPSEAADKLMAAAAEKNKDPERRFLARYRLAQYLKGSEERRVGEEGRSWRSP